MDFFLYYKCTEVVIEDRVMELSASLIKVPTA